MPLRFIDQSPFRLQKIQRTWKRGGMPSESRTSKENLDFERMNKLELEKKSLSIDN